MSEIVFILGAGASKAAGAPLMDDFLDVAERLLRAGKVHGAKDEFELVFKAYAELDLVHAKSNIKLRNLEEVFAAFEMAKLLGRLGNLKPKEINSLPGAMQQLILHTLEAKIPLRRDSRRLLPPEPYGRFIKLISGVGGARKVSLITFNYDLCLDYACWLDDIDINYCLEHESSNSGMRLLKLHGSLNWGRCPTCRKIVPWKLDDYHARSRTSPLANKEGPVILPIGSSMHAFRHCGTTPVKGPFIVPPTWNKGEHHRELARVWRAAAAELQGAEQIFVCGYSLPETDQFFRFLYALGSVGPARLKRFCVVDPCQSEDVMNRFRALLGNAVGHCFDPLTEQFEIAMEKLRERLER